MKAMILAAGLGTRLLPYTRHTPKPLFTLSGRTLLDITIRNLERAGFESVMINTHHLHRRIDSFLRTRDYTILVDTCYEPSILGTGGAVKNVDDIWGKESFLVINSDIVTDIDLKNVCDFHRSHPFPATMVFVDDPQINTVLVGRDGFVLGFETGEQRRTHSDAKPLTFTGIQVLDPSFLRFIPENAFYSIIDAYRELMASGGKIKSYIASQNSWKDLGTAERYGQAVFDIMAPEAFDRAFPGCRYRRIERAPLKGDGSDRHWYRLNPETGSDSEIGSKVSDATPPRKSGYLERTLIMADHGIRSRTAWSEVDAFVAIGHHLYRKGLPVPRIYHYDTFSGCVFLEDLGDINLQQIVRQTKDPKELASRYESVIDLLIDLSVKGAQGFDTAWTYQSASYDKDLILTKECRYFADSFLKGYLGLTVDDEVLETEFTTLADRALAFATDGFMHRDFQSRNIMVKNDACYFIDFQGGRMGPIQYDLASLLIDPYVDLPREIRTHLVEYAAGKASERLALQKNHFRSCFMFCSVTRNLQILGAFAYLSRIKGKKYFADFIPAALKTLAQNLSLLETGDLKHLRSIVEKIVPGQKF
jgi:NDP-sugar pyrophosphorylase family protein